MRLLAARTAATTVALVAALTGCNPLAGAVKPSPAATPTPSEDAVRVTGTAPPLASAPPGCDPGNREAAEMQRIFSPGGGPDDILVVGDTVYVSLRGVGKVAAVPRNGEPSTIASGLDHPEGLAPAPGGDLYVVEQGKNRIDVVSGDGRGRVTPLKTFSNPSGRLGIDSIHLEDNGNLLVPDSPSGQLLEFAPSTGGVRTLATGLGRPVDAIQYAGQYAVADEDKGLLMVSTQAPAAGQPDAIVSRLADIPLAADLELDAAGNLLVTSLGRGAVFRYQNGQATAIARGFGAPQGLALDSEGSLLVIDSNAGAVLVLGRSCLG